MAEGMTKSYAFMKSLFCQVVLFTVLAFENVYAEEQCASDQWGQLHFGDVTVYNNLWGNGAGTQKVCASGKNGMTVTANHTLNGGGIKSYPNISVEPKRDLSSFQAITVDISQTLPTGGEWNAAFDIWDDENKYEIMLWLNHSQGVAPIAQNYGADGKAVPNLAGIKVSGITWNVFLGSNGSNKVISLQSENPMTEVKALDVLALMKFIQEKNYICKVFRIGKIQYGFEITATEGEGVFGVTNYNLVMQ